MADILTGVTETVAAAHEEVSKMAQEYLVQQSVLMPAVSDFSALAVKGANSIALPIVGGFSVASKVGGTQADASTSAFSKDQIALNQHRYIQWLIEDISDWQSNVGVLAEYVKRATADLALDIDEKIIAELALASSTAPDHQLKFNDIVNNDLELIDLLEARKLMIDKNINPKELTVLIPSSKEKDMLQIDNFIDASKYGSSEGVMNGEIGRAYGMRVLVHTSVASSAMSVFHKSAVGFALQQGMRFQSEKDLANLGTRFSIDYLGGFKVLDGGERCVYTTNT